MGGPVNFILFVTLAVVVALIGWQMTRSVGRLNAAQRAGAFASPAGPEREVADSNAIEPVSLLKQGN